MAMERMRKRSTLSPFAPLAAFAVFAACAVVLALASACCPCRNLATSTTDSVRVERVEWTEYVTDTLWFPLPAESVSVLRPDSSHLETQYAVSDAVLTADGLLFHTLFNKAADVPIGYEKPIVHVDSTTDRVVTHTEIVSVPRELTGWQRFQITGFWFCLAALALIIALCVIRILR